MDPSRCPIPPGHRNTLPQNSEQKSGVSKTKRATTPPKPRRKRMKPEDVPEEIRDQMVKAFNATYGIRGISRQFNLSRKNTRTILEQEGCQLSDKQQAQSLLVPFHTIIREKVEKDLTASRILREITAQGFTGKRTILADYVRQLRMEIRPRSVPRPVKRRFETPNSYEMQIDWSPYQVLIAGVLVPVHAFGCLLCASRKLFLHFFLNERQPVLLEGMAMAFEYFDGCAQRVVSDNMSTVVLGRYAQNGKPIWHERYKQFYRHYGFQAFACKPRDPDRKGKKEKSFRLVWDDFLKGSNFASLEDLNHRARIWLDHTPEAGNLRIHGTTGRVPNEAFLAERELLIRLPEQRFPVFDDEPRIVDQDSTISVRGKRYTVPSILANRTVRLRLFAEHFEVIDRYGQVAFSQRYVDKQDHRKLIIDETHYATLPRRPHLGEERLDQAFLKRFPSLAPLVTGMQRNLKAIAPIHLRSLVRLAEAYGQDTFLDVAHRVQQARRFDATAIKRILERERGPILDDTTLPLRGSGADIIGEVDEDSLDSFAHLDKQDPNIANR